MQRETPDVAIENKRDKALVNQRERQVPRPVEGRRKKVISIELDQPAPFAAEPSVQNREQEVAAGRDAAFSANRPEQVDSVDIALEGACVQLPGAANSRKLAPTPSASFESKCLVTSEAELARTKPPWSRTSTHPHGGMPVGGGHRCKSHARGIALS